MPNYPYINRELEKLKRLNVDNGVLYVDPINNRVGINDNSPSYSLDVNGDIHIQAGHQIIFPDSSTMNTAAVVGAAASASNDDDLILTADGNTDTIGAIILKIGSDTFAQLLNSGDFQLIKGATGASASSNSLYFTGNFFNGSDHTINATIQLVTGAAPYLQIAVPDDGATPVLTNTLRITDTEFYPATTNVVDIGLTGTRFKNAYFSGTVTTVNATITGNLQASGFTLIDTTTGSSVSSPALYLTGNYWDGAADHTIQSTITLVTGVDPYLQIAVPDDGTTPALTNVLNIKDTVIYPSTNNTVDLGLTGTRFKNAYFSGTVTTVNATITGTFQTSSFTLIDTTTGSGVDSPVMSLTGNYWDGAVDHAISATIQLITGVDPYLQIAVPDDGTTPALTNVLDIKDTVIYPETDSAVDLGISTNKFKSAYFSGTVVAHTALQMLNSTTGSSVDSPLLRFTSNYFNGSDHAIEATIQLISSAAPYLQIAVPDDGATPALTNTLRITDTEFYPATTNVVDIGLTGTRFKNAYFSGAVTTVNAIITGEITIAAFTTSLAAKSGDYILTGTDNIVTVDTSGGAVTITLPTAVGITGRHYIIKKISNDGQNLIVEGDGVETIDGLQQRVIISQWVTIEVVSDGSNWIII